MARVQLALNVSNIEAAIKFYSELFRTDLSMRIHGYANFATDEPPLKLVLIENGEDRGNGVNGALNHLGIEVLSVSEVIEATDRFANTRIETVEESTTCCYAVQDKVWVHDPDELPWETYVVLEDVPVSTGLNSDGSCCADSQIQLVGAVNLEQTAAEQRCA